MSLFMLDTDIISSSAGAMKSLSTQFSDLANTINGYDTDCEGGFDFASAKKVISQNIEACATKVTNTALYMNRVVDSHTQLQAKEFIDPAEKERREKEAAKKNQQKNSSPGSDSSRSSNRSPSSSTVSASAAALTTEAKDLADSIKESSSRVGEVKANLKNVQYVSLDTSLISDSSIALLNDSEVKYTSDGYAMVGSRYLIACDSSIGKVGDVIRFTKSDGTVIECVVCHNTVGEKYKDTINFIINPDSDSLAKRAECENLLTNLSKIENLGSLDSVRKTDLNNIKINTVTTTDISNKEDHSENKDETTSAETSSAPEVIYVEPSQRQVVQTPVQHTGISYSESTGFSSDIENVEDVLEEEAEPELTELIEETTTTSIDDVIKGDTYKIPQSTTPIQTTKNKHGNILLPIAAGLSAAAAAGIGAKAYMDRKRNNDNGEDDEYGDEDWVQNDELSSSDYSSNDSNSIEELSSDSDYEADYHQDEEEKYGARSNEDLADI